MSHAKCSRQGDFLDDYVDYDSDEGVNVTTQETSRALSDPYAGS